MIWVIAFFIIILISSVLAYRSMRDYEEFPDSSGLMALFYIGNPANLTVEVLEKLRNKFSSQRFFSLEKLIKGQEAARVIFGSREMVSEFKELNLVEIEDYLASDAEMLTSVDYEHSSSSNKKKSNVNQVLSWLIEPKNNPKKALVVSDELKNLKVEADQKVFIQLVLMPVGEGFQTTMRVMVSDPDSIKRVELAKKINQIFSGATGLNKHEDSFPEAKKYESFKQRSLVPKEVSLFPLTASEVLSLVS